MNLLRRSPLTGPRKGSTMIEFIIYIAISAVVVVALTRSVLMLLSVQKNSAITQPTQEEMRFAMRRLATTIRDSREINVADSVFLADEGTLSLAMSDAAMNPTVFSLVDGEILITEGTEAPMPLTSSRIIVEQMRFENLSAPETSGTIHVRVQAKDAESQKTMTIETAISLRQ